MGKAARLDIVVIAGENGYKLDVVAPHVRLPECRILARYRYLPPLDSATYLPLREYARAIGDGEKFTWPDRIGKAELLPYYRRKQSAHQVF